MRHFLLCTGFSSVEQVEQSRVSFWQVHKDVRRVTEGKRSQVPIFPWSRVSGQVVTHIFQWHILLFFFVAVEKWSESLQSCQKSRQNLAKTRGCRGGCISACLLGKFFSGMFRGHLVGRLRCSPLDTGAFWLDFAYCSGNTKSLRPDLESAA